MTRFSIEIEETENGFSAHSPDFPGIGAAAETKEECERLLAEAIQEHLMIAEELEGGIITSGVNFGNFGRNIPMPAEISAWSGFTAKLQEPTTEEVWEPALAS